MSGLLVLTARAFLLRKKQMPNQFMTAPKKCEREGDDAHGTDEFSGEDEDKKRRIPPDHAGKEKLTANAMKDETGVALSRNSFLYVTNM